MIQNCVGCQPTAQSPFSLLLLGDLEEGARRPDSNRQHRDYKSKRKLLSADLSVHMFRALPIELHRAYSVGGFLRSRGVEPREKSVVNISIYFAVSVPARHAIALPPDAPHVAGLSRLSAVFPAVAASPSFFCLHILLYKKSIFGTRNLKIFQIIFYLVSVTTVPP